MCLEKGGLEVALAWETKEYTGEGICLRKPRNWRKIRIFLCETHFKNSFPQPLQYGTPISLP